MLSIAASAQPAETEPQRRALAASLGLHSGAVGILFMKPWILSLVAALLALFQASPAPQPAVTVTRVFAPPAGKSGGEDPGSGGSSPAIDDSTEIVWAADYARQLLPVLRANRGLVVFVEPLARTRPKIAFRADGSQVDPPATLDHYVRLRIANPSWWPEIEELCAQADPDRKLDVMAVFPPAFRATLGAAVQARLSETHRVGRVVRLNLSLDAPSPAGVTVREIGVEAIAPPKAKTTG